MYFQELLINEFDLTPGWQGLPPFSFTLIAGGIFSFTMRNQDVKQYEDKMLELEKSGKWQNISREKMPYFGSEGLPKEVNGFVYKVLKN